MKVGDIVDGKYRLVRLVGIGGVGVAYEVLHEETGERLALRCLLPKMASSDASATRFIETAKAAGTIESQHIVSVYDTGLDADGTPYLVGEYLEGENLEVMLMREGRLTEERAVALMIQVCDALDLAHQRGLIHRALKPENLFIVRLNDDSEWVKILDFGIAEVRSPLADRSAEVAGTVATMGTPHYMAPEQFESTHDLDPRIDVYSVGIILYELLSGRRPYRGNTYEELIAELETGDVPPLRSIAPSLDADLAAIVERSMARRPDSRFSSMTELAAALRSFADLLLLESEEVDTLVDKRTVGRRSSHSDSIQGLSSSSPASETPATDGALAPDDEDEGPTDVKTTKKMPTMVEPPPDEDEGPTDVKTTKRMPTVVEPPPDDGDEELTDVRTTQKMPTIARSPSMRSEGASTEDGHSTSTTDGTPAEVETPPTLVVPPQMSADAPPSSSVTPLVAAAPPQASPAQESAEEEVTWKAPKPARRSGGGVALLAVLAVIVVLLVLAAIAAIVAVVVLDVESEVAGLSHRLTQSPKPPDLSPAEPVTSPTQTPPEQPAQMVAEPTEPTTTSEVDPSPPTEPGAEVSNARVEPRAEPDTERRSSEHSVEPERSDVPTPQAQETTERDSAEANEDTMEPRAISTGGFLSVKTQPPTKLYVDGRYLQKTPVTRHELTAGRHLVTMISEDASIRETESVEIEANKTSSIVRDFRAQEKTSATTGTLSVASRPPTKVYVDGRFIQNTPLRNHELSVGTHRLTLINLDNDIRHSSSITINAGEETTVTRDFRSDEPSSIAE